MHVHVHVRETEPILSAGRLHRTWKPFGGAQPDGRCLICASGVPLEVLRDDPADVHAKARQWVF